MFEIIDNDGVIHSSTDKEEMETAFDCMVNPDKYDQQEKNMWLVDWKGDLKFVEVINLSK
jgi:hypothetical protein